MGLKTANPDQEALLEHLVAIDDRLTERYDCLIQGVGWSMSVILRDRVSGRKVWDCAEEPRVIADRFADWVVTRDRGPSS